MESRLESILAAVPYALRGVSTPELPFNAVGQIASPSSLPSPIATILPGICEPCILYRALDVTLKHSSPEGLSKQALFSAIRESLRSYSVLVSEIEAEIEKPDFSLAKAQCMLQSPCIYLRLFNTILHECTRARHNPLSVIWEFTNHGDPLVSSYSKELFNSVIEPFQRIRDQWESFGSLQLDLFHEFYIAQDNESNEFHIVEANIPYGISSVEDVQLSFERGRAMHFIRKICGDLDFTGAEKTSVQIMQHSQKSSIENNQLLLHLRGLRDYMSLGNGNFVDALFRNDKTNFLKAPVNEVGSYLASEFFLAAIDDAKQVNESPVITKALDAKIMGIEGMIRGKQSDSLVWEAFVGKYHIDAQPSQRIIDAPAIKQYERCFASLWRVRFAVHCLNSAASSLRPSLRDLSDDLDKADIQLLCQVHATMTQTFLKLQMHFYYDIIEREWLTLSNTIQKSKMSTIAQIKQAHAAYLDEIVKATAEPSRFQQIDAATREALQLQTLFETNLKGSSDSEIRQELLQMKKNFDSTIVLNEVIE